MGQRQGDKMDKFLRMAVWFSHRLLPKLGVIPAQAGIHPEMAPQPQGGWGWAT